jgi:hypothetical protein
MRRVPFTCPRVALPFSLSDAKIPLLETLPRREGGWVVSQVSGPVTTKIIGIKLALSLKMRLVYSLLINWWLFACRCIEASSFERFGGFLVRLSPRPSEYVFHISRRVKRIIQWRRMSVYHYFKKKKISRCGMVWTRFLAQQLPSPWACPVFLGALGCSCQKKWATNRTASKVDTVAFPKLANIEQKDILIFSQVSRGGS